MVVMITCTWDKELIRHGELDFGYIKAKDHELGTEAIIMVVDPDETFPLSRRALLKDHEAQYFYNAMIEFRKDQGDRIEEYQIIENGIKLIKEINAGMHAPAIEKLKEDYYKERTQIRKQQIRDRISELEEKGSKYPDGHYIGVKPAW